MKDKPLQIVPKCVRCGRAKNQHRALTLECPKGKRTSTGYVEFAMERFAEADIPAGTAEASSEPGRS